MSESNPLMMNDSLLELSKLIAVMDEDAPNLSASQAISDYIAPILESMLAEIEANRQYVLQAADRANLAMLVNERTFIGEILTSIAEHFATVIDELPEDTDADSKLGVAVTEIQDLLATWMSFDLTDEEVNEDSEEDEDDDDHSFDDDSLSADEDSSLAQTLMSMPVESTRDVIVDVEKEADDAES